MKELSLAIPTEMCLCHAVDDALLGACGLGNIGEMFPDTDPTFKGMSSFNFTEEDGRIHSKEGIRIGNIDSNILAERPKLAAVLSRKCKQHCRRLWQMPKDSVPSKRRRWNVSESSERKKRSQQKPSRWYSSSNR